MARIQSVGGQPAVYNASGFTLDDMQPCALQVDANGNLKVSATLNVGDIEIGAVEIKNGTDDTRAVVSSQGNLYTTHGKTIKSVTGSISATTTIVAAVTSKRIKVIALDLITASTTAVTVTFKDGAAGTALAAYPLQALSGTNFGVTKNVPAPSFLFATSAGNLLELSFSAAQTVTYNLTYFDDDAA